MAVSKKINKVASFRKNVKEAGKWMGKMRKKGKIRKSDVAKLKIFKKRQIEEADKHWTKLTDDLEHARLHEAEYFDRLSANYGVPSSSDDDEPEGSGPMKKRIKLEQEESDDEKVSGDELEMKFSNAAFSSADQPKEETFFTPLPESNFTVRNLKQEADFDEKSESGGEMDHKMVEGSSEMSASKLFASRAQIVNDFKYQIATKAKLIIEQPQEHIHKLKLLVQLAKGVDVTPLAMITVQKLATASLLEVFLDIIPSYHIRQWTEEEEKQKMSKNTMQLHEYEQTLLRNYEKYLKHLNALCKCTSNNRLYRSTISPSLAESFKLLGLRSACHLLTDHFHFNFRALLLDAIVPNLSDRNDTVRSITCDCVESVFSSDKLGETSYAIVRSICKFVKDNSSRCHPQMLQTFLRLKIKQIEKKDEKQKTRRNLLAKKQKIKLMSRKEKKMHKRLKKLDDELEELDAEENENTVLKFHTRIMEQVFGVYFRLLKRRLPGATGSKLKLLGPVLEGLSKFAHLINVEFFDDLINSLLDLVHVGGIGIVNSLHSVKTAFTILSGEGQALTIDPYGFYKFVYSALLRMANQKNKALRKTQLCLALNCLDLMLSKRRKQVSLARVAAFVKRLVRLASKFDEPETVAILLSVRSMFVAHPKLESLIDEENAEIGSGVYLADLDDPDRCNAQSTSILDDLKKLQELNKDARKLALYIQHGLPCNGPFSISIALASKLAS